MNRWFLCCSSHQTHFPIAMNDLAAYLHSILIPKTFLLNVTFLYLDRESKKGHNIRSTLTANPSKWHFHIKIFRNMQIWVNHNDIDWTETEFRLFLRMAQIYAKKKKWRVKLSYYNQQQKKTEQQYIYVFIVDNLCSSFNLNKLKPNKLICYYKYYRFS